MSGSFWVEVLLLATFWAIGVAALLVLGRWEAMVVPALLTPVCAARIRRTYRAGA